MIACSGGHGQAATAGEAVARIAVPVIAVRHRATALPSLRRRCREGVVVPWLTMPPFGSPAPRGARIHVNRCPGPGASESNDVERSQTGQRGPVQRGIISAMTVDAPATVHPMRFAQPVVAALASAGVVTVITQQFFGITQISPGLGPAVLTWLAAITAVVMLVVPAAAVAKRPSLGRAGGWPIVAVG